MDPHPFFGHQIEAKLASAYQWPTILEAEVAKQSSYKNLGHLISFWPA